MAILETIRVKIGWLITALIAIALLSFIVDFNSLSAALQSTSDKYSVGKVNGQKVSYSDFQKELEYQTQVNEIINGSATTDEQQKSLRDAAWQSFVDKYMFLKKARAAGIEVGKDEMVDLTSGEMISPIIAYNPAFGSANGEFNRENLVAFVQNIESDASGNYSMYWNYIQNAVLTQQYYAKYGSLFSQSGIVNPVEMKEALDGNNITASVQAVMVPYGYDKDSTITVSSSEIKKYYAAHKEQYKQVANRDIRYALFEVVPSEADKDAARKSVEDVYDEFALAGNIKNFLMRNSEQSLRNYYYKDGELNTVSRQVNDFVFGDAKGVSPVYNEGDVYMAVKVVDTRNLPDSVFVRHILIQGDNNLADSLFTVVSKDKSQFSAIAALYSADKNPNVAQPGDLGWMTQSYMIPGMESVIGAQVGKPFILDTQYGRHIVEVTKKTKDIQKKQVAILQKTALPSKATMNEFYNKANALATQAAGSLEKLEAAASEQGAYLHSMNVTDATARYGSVDRAKEVTRWVFDAKKGAASNVITVNSNYLFVVGVRETHKEGYIPVAEAATRINDVLYNQKKADKLAAEVAAKIEGCTDIDAVAKALDQSVYTRDNISFASAGRSEEPAFVGAVSGAKEGVVTGPVKGYMGVYVLVVNSRESGEFYTEDDAKALAAQKNQYTSQMILPAMFASCGGVDHREKFY